MGTIYVRGSKLWLGFKDTQGKWVYRASGYSVGQESLAERRLAALEKAITGGETSSDGVPTVAQYAMTWVKARIAEGLSDASREKGRLERYVVNSALGPLRLDHVERKHIRAWLTALKSHRWQRMVQKKGGGDKVKHGEPERLAPRTIRATYGILHSMFESAVDTHLSQSPAKLKKRELPKKADKDPSWRHTAVYRRDEVELLISDARVPFVRRVVYALGFLGALRAGEVGALRWRHIDTASKPLGVMHVVASWNQKMKREQPPKSGFPRDVPIHPGLAKLLAQLKLQVSPSADDLVVPTKKGTRRSDRGIRDGMEIDFAALELRWRRFHDARRTFTSLARAGGADKGVLHWVTHGPENEDIVDVYTSLPWPVLCDAVLRVNIGLLEGQLHRLRATGTTELLHSNEAAMQERGTEDENGDENDAPRGIRTHDRDQRMKPRRDKSGASAGDGGDDGPESADDCRNVVSGADRLAWLFGETE